MDPTGIIDCDGYVDVDIDTANYQYCVDTLSNSAKFTSLTANIEIAGDLSLEVKALVFEAIGASTLEEIWVDFFDEGSYRAFIDLITHPMSKIKFVCFHHGSVGHIADSLLQAFTHSSLECVSIPDKDQTGFCKRAQDAIASKTRV
jgi:hypothetical protein